MKRIMTTAVSAAALTLATLIPAGTANAAPSGATEMTAGSSAKAPYSCWVQGVPPYDNGRVNGRENSWCNVGARQIFERVQLQKFVNGYWRTVATKQGSCFNVPANVKCYTIASTFYSSGRYRTKAYSKIWLYGGQVLQGNHISAVRYL